MSTLPTQSSVSHATLNVRDLEASHRFWIEVMGWELAGAIDADPHNPVVMEMRFYRRDGRNHHDIALAQLYEPEQYEIVEPDMRPLRPGVNHIALRYDNRDDWLRIVQRIEDSGYPIYGRVDHGMTHSIYIADPDGMLFEILYDLPREVWEGDVDAALQFGEFIERDRPGYLPDNTNYRIFGEAAVQ